MTEQLIHTHTHTMTIININMCVTFINFHLYFTGIYTKSYRGKLNIAKDLGALLNIT